MSKEPPDSVPQVAMTSQRTFLLRSGVKPANVSRKSMFGGGAIVGTLSPGSAPSGGVYRERDASSKVRSGGGGLPARPAPSLRRCTFRCTCTAWAVVTRSRRRA